MSDWSMDEYYEILGNIPDSIGNNFDLVEKKFENGAMGDKTELNKQLRKKWKDKLEKSTE